MTALPMFLLHESGLHVAVVAQLSVLDEVILRSPKRILKSCLNSYKTGTLPYRFLSCVPTSVSDPNPYGSALILIGWIRIQAVKNEN
jgi:hypothetical protein